MVEFDEVILYAVIVITFVFLIGSYIFAYTSFLEEQVCENYYDGEYSYNKLKCKFLEDGYLVEYDIEKYKGEYVLVKSRR